LSRCSTQKNDALREMGLPKISVMSMVGDMNKLRASGSSATSAVGNALSSCGIADINKPVIHKEVVSNAAPVSGNCGASTVPMSTYAVSENFYLHHTQKKQENKKTELLSSSYPENNKRSRKTVRTIDLLNRITTGYPEKDTRQFRCSNSITKSIAVSAKLHSSLFQKMKNIWKVYNEKVTHKPVLSRI
jgi:hypothetical protein